MCDLIKKISISIFLTLLGSIVYAQTFSLKGDITDDTGRELPGCSVLLLTNGDVISVGTTTDDNGRFAFTDVKTATYKIRISLVGYESYECSLHIKTDTVLPIIRLKEKVENLEEVVVSANLIQHFADHKEYHLSPAEKQQYASALAAVEKLPKVNVKDQTVSLMNGKEVRILINGVPATPTDLALISPADVKKMDYYTHPPVNYSNLGLGAVVNVKTKQAERGISLALNTQNAVNNGFGNNSVKLKSNMGKSQLGLLYAINYRKHNDANHSSLIEYAIDTARVKQTEPKPAQYKYIEQKAVIDFCRIKTDDSNFSTKLEYSSFDRSSEISQIVTVNRNNPSSGYGHDDDGYKKISMDVYYDNQLSEKQNIAFNAVATRYKSYYNYNYSETFENDTIFDTHTSVDNVKRSVIGDLSYSYSFEKLQLSVGCRGTAGDSKNQINLSGIQTYDLYLYAGISGNFTDNFEYNLSGGYNLDYFNNVDNTKYKFGYFRPELSASYYIDDNNSLELSYETQTKTPSIGELTNTSYYKDSKYIFEGNPNLKPYNNHAFTLEYCFEKKWIGYNVAFWTELANNKIGTSFAAHDKLVKETFVNMRESKLFGADIFGYWYPFKSNLLRLRLYASIEEEINRLDTEKTSHTLKYLSADAVFTYKKFGITAFYQTPKEELDGQMLKSKSAVAACEFTYRPIKNMSVSAAIRYPFFKGNVEKEMSIGSSVIKISETDVIKDYANMVYVNFIYNLNWGKDKSAIKQKLKNVDTDTGILNRL